MPLYKRVGTAMNVVADVKYARVRIQKGTSAQQSIFIYYHIGVKMDNMFRPSSGHHQVQYKEMWGSTESRTQVGSN